MSRTHSAQSLAAPGRGLGRSSTGMQTSGELSATAPHMYKPMTSYKQFLAKKGAWEKTKFILKRGAYEFLKAALAAIATGALAAGVEQGVTSATAKYLENVGATAASQDPNLRIQQSQVFEFDKPTNIRKKDRHVVKKVHFETPILFPTSTHWQYPTRHSTV